MLPKPDVIPKPAVSESAIALRQANLNDCTALQRLLTAANVGYWTMETPGVSVEHTRQRLMLPPESHSILVACARDGIVGTLGLTLHLSSPSRSVASIGSFVVSHTGHAIESQLLEWAINLADRTFNAMRLELLVFADNKAAIALYQRQGFAIESTLRNCGFCAGQYVDVHIMGRAQSSSIPRPAL